MGISTRRRCISRATMGDAVRFRVLKGSKFLFECEIARAEALPAALQHHVVRANEMNVLRDVDIAITKRLNLVEVDRMIACCRQHPPQALVQPVSEAEALTAFEDFSAYLKQRERAGVGSINPGMLVLLIPLENRSDTMRCQIVNTSTTVAEIGAQLSSAFARTVAQDAQPDGDVVKETLSSNADATNGTNEQGDDHLEIDSIAAIATEEDKGERNGSIAQLEGCDPFEELRQEHGAFNAFYHHVLLEWSTKPSDTDSRHENLRQE